MTDRETVAITKQILADEKQWNRCVDKIFTQADEFTEDQLLELMELQHHHNKMRQIKMMLVNEKVNCRTEMEKTRLEMTNLTKEIERLKLKLEQAKTERDLKMEYDVAARKVLAQPTVEETQKYN
jgi:hypothetical protein